MSSSMTTTTTVTTSTRAAAAVHVENIEDENILRDMWVEAQDGDVKRVIRSRMFKLREERLKDFYNREGVLDDILKPDPKSEVMTTVTSSPKAMNGKSGSGMVAQSMSKTMTMTTTQGKEGFLVSKTATATATARQVRTMTQTSESTTLTSGVKGGKMTTTTTTTTTGGKSKRKSPPRATIAIKEKERSPSPITPTPTKSTPRFMAATKSSRSTINTAANTNNRTDVKISGKTKSTEKKKGCEGSPKSVAATKSSTKAEESIIRELDILDSFLSTRSTSVDESTHAHGVNGSKAGELVDVQLSGLEPIVTKKVYKTDCPGDDDHDHRNHAPKRSSTLKSTKGKTTETTITKSTSSKSTAQSNHAKTNSKQTSGSETKKAPRQPSPNPRPGKGSKGSSPEPHRIVKKDAAKWNPEDDLDADDNPLKPQTRFGGQSKGLESPGAVLKAKSLFENKASEAAMDRSSGGFSPSSPSFKVTKNAAIFEARSRGERVSISSESSCPVDDVTGAVAETKPEVIDPTVTAGLEKPRARDTSPKPQRIQKTVPKTPIEQSNRNEAKTVKTVEVENSNSTISKPVWVGTGSAAEITDAQRERGVKKMAGKSNSAGLETRVEALLSRTSKTSMTVTQKRESVTLESVTIKIDNMDNVEELEVLLDKATDYDERSKIRARIRALKRRANLDKSAVGAESPALETTVAKNTGTNAKLYGRKSSADEDTSPTTDKIKNRISEPNACADAENRKPKNGSRDTSPRQRLQDKEMFPTATHASTAQNSRKSDRRRSSKETREEIVETTTKTRAESTKNVRKTSGETLKARKDSKGSPSPNSSREPSPGKNLETKTKTESTKHVRKSSGETLKARKDSKGSPSPNSSREPSPGKNLETKTETTKHVRKSSGEALKGRKDSKGSPSPNSSRDPSPGKNLETTTKTKTESTKHVRKTSGETLKGRKDSKGSPSPNSSRAPSPGKKETGTRVESPRKSEPKETNSELYSTRKLSKDKMDHETKGPELRSLIPRRSPSPEKQGTDISRNSSRKIRTLQQRNSIEDFEALERKVGDIDKNQINATSRDKAPPPKCPVIENPAQTTGLTTVETKISKFSRESSNLQAKYKGRSLTDSEVTKSEKLAENYPQKKSMEDSPRKRSSEELPQKRSREDSPRKKSTDDSPQKKSTDQVPLQKSTSDSPRKKTTNDSPQKKSTDNSPRKKSTDDSPRKKSTDDSPRKKSSDKTPSQKSDVTTRQKSDTNSCANRRSSDDNPDTGIPSPQRNSSPERKNSTGFSRRDSTERQQRYERRNSSKEIKTVPAKTQNKENRIQTPPTTTTTSSTTISASSTIPRGKNSLKSTTTATASTTISAKSSAKTMTSEQRNVTDSVTSSYGIGPTDDDGMPLFGLRALRKIKQVQEIPAVEISAKSNIEESHSNLRTSDFHGLRALRKTTTTQESTHTSATAQENMDDSDIPETDRTLLFAEERPGSAPKSILKKTSSFSSNQSDSKTELDALGQGQTQGHSTTTMTSSTSKLFGSAHSARSDDWKRASASPEPMPTTTLSRGRVGRSSVREMSRKFESGGEEDIGTGPVPSGTTRTKISVVTKRMVGESDPEETGIKTTATVTTRIEQSGNGRSFLSDMTPAQSLADVLERMKGEEPSTSCTEEESGRNLLNKFIGSQILLQGVEPLVLAGSKLVDCDGDVERGMIESRLKSLDLSGGEGTSTSTPSSRKCSATASSAADVTGELMPLVLGQLQNSLHSFSAVALGRVPPGGGSSSGSSHSSGKDNDKGEESPEECLFDSGTESGEDAPPTGRSSPKGKGSPTLSQAPPAEFSSFMEGLRNSIRSAGRVGGAIDGEGVSGTHRPTPAKAAANVIVPGETDLLQQVDSVLTLLRDSIATDPNFLALKMGGVPGDVGRGKELIALIDRLKTSLPNSENSSQGNSNNAPAPPLPILVGQGAETPPMAEPRPPDLPQHESTNHKASNSWILKSTTSETDACADVDAPWKIRAAKKRSQRSRSVGVSDEELAEARRYLQEEAFRSALQEGKTTAAAFLSQFKAGVPAPAPLRTWKSDIEKGLTSVPRPFVRPVSWVPEATPTPTRRTRIGSVDDASFLPSGAAKLKPFRTFSLDNSWATKVNEEVPSVSAAASAGQSSPDATTYDPSRALFTPAEIAQIEIHKAAIKKQMSAEEERRKVRGVGLGVKVGAALAGGPPTPPPANKELLVGLPKPWAAPRPTPSSVEAPAVKTAVETENPAAFQIVQRSRTSSVSSDGAGVGSQQNRIENVQISLTELNLNSTDFPQLQIAITLNTAGGGGSGAGGGNNNTKINFKTTAAVHTPVETSSGIQSLSDDGTTASDATTTAATGSDTKATRYKSKTERRKRMKRANTIDVPHPSGYPGGEDTEGDDEEEPNTPASNETPHPFFPQSVTPTPTTMTTSTAGDRKFSAFMERAKTLGDEVQAPPPRPAYLSVHDRHWNSRFSNLKTSFESSSQGSSPSPSPVPPLPGKGRQDMTSSAGNTEHYSKPVWTSAIMEPGQMPSVVKNKLQVFEARGGARDLNPPPQPTPRPAILPKKESFQKFVEVKKPAVTGQGFNQSQPVPTHEHHPPALPPKKSAESVPPDGVHMIHATKSAIEAMQRTGQYPQPPTVPPRTAHPPQRPPPPAADKSDLPWAKRETASPATENFSRPVLTEGSARVQMSKALFESKGQETSPPPIPPKPTRLPGYETTGSRPRPVTSTPPYGCSVQKSDYDNSPHVERISGVFAPIGGASGAKFGVFGVTRSLDDGYTAGVGGKFVPPKFEDTAVVEARISAFARKEQKTHSPAPLLMRQSSAPTSADSEGLPSPTSTLIAPVLSKVMKGPQQQRATVTHSTISNLGENHPLAHRITGARSNIRSILSNYQPAAHGQADTHAQSQAHRHAQAHSEDEFSGRSGHSRSSHALPQPALLKSHSGDAIFKPPTNTHFQPTSHVREQQRKLEPPRPAHPIPKQKSFTEFPRREESTPQSTTRTQNPAEFAHFPPKTVVSVSTPSIPPPAPRQSAFPSSESLQRASSGSSIYERAQSLYISAQESGCAALAPKPRRKPPTLPRAASLFPKQYEAQMSPETVDKKTREVQAYFRTETTTSAKKAVTRQTAQAPVLPPQKLQQVPRTAGVELLPKRGADQTTSSAIQKYQQRQAGGAASGARIRKSASHGKLIHRQRSLSDGEEDVDSIFESLFKASAVESKVVQGEGNEMTDSKTSLRSLSQCQVEKTMKSSTSSTSSSSFSTKSSSTATATSAITQPPSPFNKFKQLDQQNSNSTGSPAGKPLFKFTTPALKSGAANAKEVLLYWCQCRTRDYQNVKLENFSSSWSDGLAFCALIHHFYPDSFDYDTLDAKNRRKNFELAFRIAEEKADIYPLLDVEDMMVMGSRPDWKCVFTYVQSMYRKLKDLS